MSPIEKLKNIYSWPAERPPEFHPFYWSLDGGGKHLVQEAIASRNSKILVEIGVFFAGSVLQWLSKCPDLTVIGIDPWDTNLADYYLENGKYYGDSIVKGNLTTEDLYNQLNLHEGAYLSMLSNTWDYQDRYIPMRGKSPEKLYELKDMGVIPDIVFIDSDKSGRDLEVCYELFPDCTITGDDWNWTQDGKTCPIREAVESFAASKGLEITVSRETWVLTK